MLHSIFQSDAAPDEEILRQADYNLSRVSRAVRNPRAKEKFLYPAYQLRDTSHRDLVKGAKTGSRSSLTKRFDGCLMHNKGAFTSFSNLYRTTPRFISRRTASDLQSNMIFSVYRSYYLLFPEERGKWRFEERIRTRKERRNNVADVIQQAG